MKLLVGLGNPGERYQMTRHNAGFLILDLIAQNYGATWQDSKFEALAAKCEIEGVSCYLIKPKTFMNLSGRSVGLVARFYKLTAKDVTVFHDDIDVPLGKVKMRVGGGHGGHNGVRSIASVLGSSDFYRIKLGVGRPSNPSVDVSSWVLGRLTDSELTVIRENMVDESLVRLKSIIAN